MLEIENQSKKILRNLSLASKKARNGADKGLWFAGKELQKDLQENIKDKSSKSGKIYKYKGRQIRASAPDEYPANRSGNLRRSVGFSVQGQKMEFGYRSSVNYGVFLEKGTSKMRKRAGLEKTVKKNETKILNIVATQIKRELEK